MNRTTNLVLGIVLLVVGVVLLLYRFQGGARLAEPLPVVITVLAVISLLGGFASIGRSRQG